MSYPLLCFWNNCFCIMRVLLRVSLLLGSTAHVRDMVHGAFALFYFFLLCVISLILGGWGWVGVLYDFLYYNLSLAWISVDVNFMPLCNSSILYTLFYL